MSDPIDISRLRDLAREATPGPWGWARSREGARGGECAVRDDEDARYLAALDPTTVLALLDRLEAAEEEAQHQREQADAFNEAHKALFVRVAPLEAERDRLLSANANNLAALQDHVERLGAMRAERDEARAALGALRRDVRGLLSEANVEQCDEHNHLVTLCTTWRKKLREAL